MRVLWLLVLLPALFFISPAKGQQHYFKHFTSENGLPGNRVYRVFSDSKGYIWFATENGICRYDGFEFTYFKEKDGFPDYGAYHIEEGPDGKIWFVPFNGKICYYQDGKIHLPDSSIGLHKYQVTWITRDGDGLLLGTRNLYVLRLRKNKVVQSYTAGRHYLSPIVHLHRLNDSLLMYYTYFFTWILNTNTGNVRDVPKLRHDVELSHYTSVLKLRSGAILIKTSSGIFKYEKNGNLHQLINSSSPAFDHDILFLMEDPGGYIWLSRKGKLHICDPVKFNTIQVLTDLFNPVYATTDFEGGYWVCSNQGALYFRSSNNTTYTTKSGLPFNSVASIIKRSHTPPLILLEDGNSGVLKNNKFVPIHRFNIKFGYAFPRIIYTYKNYTELEWLKDVFRVTDNGVEKIKPELPYTYYDNQNNKIQITRDSLQLFVNGKRTDKLGTDRLHYTRNFHFIDQFDNFWISTVYGPYSYNHHTKSLTTLKYKYPALNQHIISIHPYRDGLIFATKSNGFYLLLNSQLLHYSIREGLSSNVLNQLYIDDDEIIWIATPEGANRITLSKENAITHITRYNTTNTLPDNNVTSILKEGKTIYLGTKTGLVTCREDLVLKPIPPPKIYITHIGANGKDTTIKRINHFDHQVNDIEIRFRGISFRSDHQLIYKYKLSPLENEWQITNQPVVRFSYLPPGNYRFIVNVCNADGIWSSAPATIKFNIIPAFWQTTSFIVISVILILTFVTLGFVAKVRQERKKAAQQKRILEADMKALQAQMNPHFIFNSLNSIQDFILDHKPEEANYYLARFATLMRTIIDYSSKESISLQQELDFLRLYMELEKLRFASGVQFTITNEIPDPESVRISPMMIQPVIENAIKHGLSQQNNNAVIAIRISEKEGLLKFEVEDNGRGMAAKNLIKNHGGHQSVGLKNIMERIELLGSKTKGGITIEDLFKQDGSPAGTKVSLYLPILNYSYD